MLGTFGLQTYIWNNRLRSIILLAGFPVLLLLICFAFALLISASNDPNVGQGFADAFALLPSLVPVAVAGAAIWFIIAFFANQTIVDLVTGGKRVTRLEEPRLYNLLENLCISRGLTMPQLRIIETDQRNAFASGVRKRQYAITVTRGLMDALDDAELEAVLAHELTHIQNRDVQLLVIAAVFVGIISLVGDLLIRGPRIWFFGGGWGGGGRRRRSGGGDGGGGGGAIVLILVAIAIFLVARLLAIALRFAVSRKREFLADAGSVDLTKNPDAMIMALRKIEGHSKIEAPSQIQEMFLDHPRETGLASLFATHPSIDARIKALIDYAGGRDPGPLPPPPPEPETPAIEAGPWANTGAKNETPGTPTTGGSPRHGPWG